MRPKFHATIDILDSDWIKSIQYDPETSTLDANLRNGSRYRYRHVSAENFSRVVTARSSGQAFNARIKGVHSCRKLPRK